MRRIETLQKLISICDSILKEGVNHTDWEEVSTTFSTLKNDIKVADGYLSKKCTQFYWHIESYKKGDINNNKHIVLSTLTLEIYNCAANTIKLLERINNK